MLERLLEKYGEMMNPIQVGEVLGQHPSHVRALCASGQLPAIRIGNRWHIVTERFAALLQEGNGDEEH